MKYLLIGLGGFAGAVTRYTIGLWVSNRFAGSFPWGTFAVNITGAFLLGLMTAMILGKEVMEPYRLPIMVGFLGSYTTFSTFSVETFKLLETGQYLLSVLYSLGSVLLGLSAVWAGIGLGKLV